MQLRPGAGDGGPALLFSATLAAAAAVSDVNLAQEICKRRLKWLSTLSTWRVFGRGWRSRVMAVEKVAVAMAEKLELPAVAVAAEVLLLSLAMGWPVFALRSCWATG